MSSRYYLDDRYYPNVELWKESGINQSETFPCPKCSTTIRHCNPDLPYRFRGWSECEVNRRIRCGVITSDYYRCPKCGHRETIHIKICESCGREVRIKSRPYTQKNCYECKPKEDMSFPETPKEILDRIHERENRLRRQYQQENYMALGDGVARDETREILQLVEGLAIDDAIDELEEYAFNRAVSEYYSQFREGKEDE